MSGQGGFQTILSGASSLTNTASVLEISKISLPELGMTDIDVSSFDSASNYMEFVGGSIDPGQIDCELNYDQDVDEDILAAYGSANEMWTIKFPDGSSWKSNGYINKMGGGSTGPNEKITRVLGIKCSGVPVQTTAA